MVSNLALLPALEKQQVWHVPTKDVVPSPFQPRKEFPADEMADLETSVRASGIQIPMLGRRLKGGDTVELVYGERRLRTAQKLNLPTVPMLLQDLTDEQVIHIQRLENAGRENLKALEAAEDYLLLESQGKTVDEICVLYGVKRSHVFTRKRVAKLPDDIKKLIREGKLAITVADLIAKLPTAELQQEVTARATKPDYYGDTLSFRGVQEIITDEYTRSLRTAPWLSTTSGDVNLIKGVTSCTTCPKRSGNMDSAGNGNICTDVKCFAAKETAHTQRLMAEAKARGHTIIDPKAYQQKSYTFEAADTECYQDQKERTWGDLAKAVKIEPAVTVTEGKLTKIFTREQQQAILAANKIEAADRASGPSAADRAKEQAEREAIETAITTAILRSSDGIENQKPAPLSLWQKLARTVVAHFDYALHYVFKGRNLKYTNDYDADWAAINDYINKQISAHNLIGLMVELLLRRKVSRHSPELLTVWGVDWKQFLPGANSKTITLKQIKAKAGKPKGAKAAKPQPKKKGKK